MRRCRALPTISGITRVGRPYDNASPTGVAAEPLGGAEAPNRFVEGSLEHCLVDRCPFSIPRCRFTLAMRLSPRGAWLRGCIALSSSVFWSALCFVLNAVARGQVRIFPGHQALWTSFATPTIVAWVCGFVSSLCGCVGAIGCG